MSADRFTIGSPAPTIQRPVALKYHTHHFLLSDRVVYVLSNDLLPHPAPIRLRSTAPHGF